MLRLVTGVVLIALILFGQDIYGILTASTRLDPTLASATGPSNVIVVLDFTPERFHNERLGSYGTFAGRDGGLSRIRLRNVTPDNLTRLSHLAWVSRIEAIPAAPAGIRLTISFSLSPREWALQASITRMAGSSVARSRSRTG